jgi:hypothetical protein
VAQFEFPPKIVILSEAVFQAERRISRSTGLARKPNCITTTFLISNATPACDATVTFVASRLPSFCTLPLAKCPRFA